MVASELGRYIIPDLCLSLSWVCLCLGLNLDLCLGLSWICVSLAVGTVLALTLLSIKVQVYRPVQIFQKFIMFALN